ncbi:MAG: peptide chain release factor N(5)-glutamine methyltransferase [Magnetococcales bacterium]|nr:peptide chain release factor N(5)-glutamine methyltransferase [Magnetococcales bacterium]
MILWTIRLLRDWSVPWLQQRGIENPRLDADLLLADALGVERLALFLDAERPVVGAELATFKRHLQRRARREPVAYILGRRGFWRQELVVTSDVLVPRPETELLVETVLAHFPPDQQTFPFEILEIGVGSGALLCALLLEYPVATGVGVDISAAALAVAEQNGRQLGCWERMTLLGGDLVAPLAVAPHSGRRFPVIVANPPYIATAELDRLEPEVAVWEPRQALDGGVDGLTVLRRIPAAVMPLLAAGGLLALEIGMTQGDAVAAVMEAAGLQDVCLHLDYSRRPRVVTGWRR